ncbi:MAG: tetratricopeptide repeat protein [Alphaproteobacteria bacterium]
MANEQLDYLWQLYVSGEYQKALEGYHSLVAKNDENLADALICSGYCYDALERKDNAFLSYLKAVEIAPNNPNSHSALACAYYEKGIIDKAEEHSKAALSLDENCITALVNMGNILDLQKNYEEALKYYQKAIEINSSYSDAYSNAASVLFSLERFDESLDYAQKAIEVNPKDVNGYINAGNALDALGKPYEAITAFNTALELDKDNFIVFNNLAGVYEKTEDFAKAGECYFKVITNNPSDNDNHLALGYLLYSMVTKKQINEAQELAKKWITAFPNNSVALHMSAAIAVGQIPKRADDDYIKKLFDAFAPDFDRSLKAIEYQAPSLIAKALNKKIPIKNSSYTILDAGCGTGLCSQYLKDYTKNGVLIGIDLSQGMLDKAKEKNMYDTLYQSEIVSFLTQHKDEYDLIVSADVFTYFGDLKNLFEGLFSALKTNGTIFFTVTRRLKKSPLGYILNASGRFSHNIDYVIKTLEDCGFITVDFEEKELRKEAGEAVMGYIVSAEKS